MIPEGQLTAGDVALHLLSLSRELTSMTEALNAADVESVEVAEDAKLAEAKAFVLAEGSVDFRKATATINTHDIRLAARVAEANVRALQRTIRTLERRIDVGRTHGATVRAEVAMSNHQPTN